VVPLVPEPEHAKSTMKERVVDQFYDPVKRLLRAIRK
jgi:hypothetical protein